VTDNINISTGLEPSTVAAEALRAKAVYGVPISVANGIDVLLADNSKDYTGPGTNTYIVGEDELWIIDPGPDDTDHVNLVVDAVAGRCVAGILVTHSHLDHSPAAKQLQAQISAPIYGRGGVPSELVIASNEDIDADFAPDHALECGEILGGGEWCIQALHTPGHFPNHLCYLLPEKGILFSGDHVMGWSTTVIVPPLGNLADYFDSLDAMKQTGASILLPSHGDPVRDASGRIEEIRAHRLMRQHQVEQLVRDGERDPAVIVKSLYCDLPPRLVQAAEGCIQAHMDYYQERRGLSGLEAGNRVEKDVRSASL
jgi:glyoxylase-like metal-dependent hydrolase (beta-lactamase superfamily II)